MDFCHLKMKLSCRRRSSDRTPCGDDDGFESLNGTGSRTSEEEIVPPASCSVMSSRSRCDDWVANQSLTNSRESVHSTELESDAETESVDNNVVIYIFLIF